MDILHEGQDGLSGARVSAAVRCPGRLPLVWLPPALEGLFVLRRLQAAGVSFEFTLFMLGRGLILSWSLAWQMAHILCLCVRETSDLSAVCAYRVSDVSRVFAEGKYKTPVTVETTFVKWVMYSGDVPVPRPGAVSLSSV